MNTVIQTYLRMCVALQKGGMPYQVGNSLKIGDNYVVAYRGSAKNYWDYKNAYITRYASNDHLGDMEDLLEKYGIDMSFDQKQMLPVSLLEVA